MITAREAAQFGAALAGFAIENAMLGAAHALANPLTAAHGIVHGQAVGVMLPHVVRFNGHNSEGDTCAAGYAELLADVGIETDIRDAGDGLADWLADLLHSSGLSTSLTACGCGHADAHALATAAAAQWTAGFNPRPVTAADLALLYEAAR